MEIQNNIKDLFFNEKYTQKQIVEILGISKQYVSKVLKADERYLSEKNERIRKNKEKHIIETKNYIKKKRQEIKANKDYEIVKLMHDQDVRELSGRKTISNRAFKKWNTSAYKYNPRTKSYHLKNNINAGFDAPKKINWKSF